jgi:hypothetical protein
MTKEVKMKVDIGNDKVEDWLVEYLGGQSFFTILRFCKKSKRREALDVMVESPEYQAIKDKVRFDSKGNMWIIFPSEKHKTLAMLK